MCTHFNSCPSFSKKRKIVLWAVSLGIMFLFLFSLIHCIIVGRSHCLGPHYLGLFREAKMHFQGYLSMEVIRIQKVLFLYCL